MPLPPYATEHPDRAAVDAMPGHVVIEFGVDWCPHCQRAAEPVAAALAEAEQSIPGGLRHLRLEDERARPLGRSFKVKLWPTLLFLKDGVEVGRVVRPTTVADVAAGFEVLGSNQELRS
jgi:thioredoxin 1